jgi:hypothetical protein
MRLLTGRGARILTLVVTLAAAGACRSGGSPTAPGPAVARARVGLIEWQVTTTAGALVAGPVTLEVTNAGTTVHDLRIKGARADARTAQLAPGQATTLAVDLTGETRVELWCTVAGHRSEGMDTHLPVRG